MLPVLASQAHDLGHQHVTFVAHGADQSLLRNTGYPGSFTTIHANTPNGALKQLALMVMQSGLGLGRTDTLSAAWPTWWCS